MLTEEAHHLFVGETGVGRTVEATVKGMSKYASWIAPPRVGLNSKPDDFEYVKIYDHDAAAGE